jgi:hypothetical protein
MTKILAASTFALFTLVTLQSCNATVRYNYGDHRGYNCNRYNDNCHYRRGWYSRHDRDYGYRRLEEITASNELAASESSASMLAGDYGIKFSSAEKILAITTNAVNRDEIVKKLNISNSDLKAISKFELPSREIMQNVAQALQERPAKIERIFTDFIADAKAEKANR